ncbi:3-[(3aS,4S,7aS)-7a-methyl-1,5-dioxo-octahydro-1H-inden-4-yl]propanoyl:CoA ligase [Planobispora rosea]|uniref:3-[(3aS,4S,7aS)-7a-methyl-1,5-dioxo-octahydro-1H-inden-4-yl]propanoyl:CoA ligase n=2 Tax=Planobispora rosea TaxID=35762 RepID=A0A8J3WBZ1_PLARO|nr:3-[(3aS,4S,7aS)-7a-methyl-1,5-dioxo-octahydro-1H-inden-4-yl]propanoyl:CoA ligase [Planobispora rosea]GIH82366.1 3-[(3aS,4S,7aS)-7a-methyl-1,5-dioxo-octahydro-1H- inden-4-yl]propanoyl:CoA ligase [Planobispora rosea]
MEVPDWGTIPRMLRDQAKNHPSDIVVADREVRISLAELRTRAASVARGLMALGVAPGDRVAIWGLNDLHWVVAAFGVWDAGAVVVPLSSRYKGIEAAGLLRATGAVVLITGESLDGSSFIDLLADATGGPVAGRPFAGLHDLRHAVVPEDRERAGTLPLFRLLSAGSRVSHAEVEERACAVRPGDLCEIMSTSGTTGTPKGVMLEHGQVLRGYWDWAEIVTLGPGDRYPVVAPFAHGFGLNAGLLACVLRRATMMPIRVFSPDLLTELIRDRRITILAGPPTLFHRILDEVDTTGHTLRVAICGAAAVPAELVRRLLERLGLERMINAYGLMEGTVVSMTRAEDPVEVIASSTGRTVPGVEVRIVDDEGAEVPAGERGEILVRGYGVMRGYWGEPARTAEVVRDGWLHTGDIGTLDPDGNLAIVDRKKELFIVNGFNVSPAEVEGLLLREGSLAQAAVVGVPDARRGEVGWAFVVPRQEAAADPEKLPEKIIAWARENMSGYKVPAHVVVVDSLPVNANGKIDKQALRERTAI